MGRRYRDEVGKLKDEITYHVYDNTKKKVAEFKDKKEALEYLETVHNGMIRKTRTQRELDKKDKV